MFTETLEKLSKASKTKSDYLRESNGKYFVASIMAGLYVGLGIFLIMTIGGLTSGMGGHFRIFIGSKLDFLHKKRAKTSLRKHL